MQIIIFYSNFTEICSKASNWQYVTIGSGNSLAPNVSSMSLGSWENAREKPYEKSFVVNVQK